MNTDLMKTHPAVFAVEDTYQIMVGVKCPTLMWVEVDGTCFYDHSNGILRSLVTTHRVTVPAALLDKAGSYTLYLQKIIERKPYFPTMEEPIKCTYEFHPVKSGRTLLYQIADAHECVDAPVRSCRVFEEKYGEIDALLLNGDVISHSGEIENFDNLYKIASDLTKGTKPVIVSRGNHDLRGLHAENLAEHTPTRCGLSYYTIRMGDIGAVLLDCGEDKVDENPEYGHTVCCHAFREQETQWLEEQLNAQIFADCKHRIIISHVPFTWRIGGKFDIEEDIYTRWATLLKEKFKPEIHITGHIHTCSIGDPGCELERIPSPCRVVSGSVVIHKEESKEQREYFIGSGFIFDENGVTVCFADSDGQFPEGQIYRR